MWINNRSEYYTSNIEKWTLVRRMYEGGNISDLLVRKSQGESPGEFAERKQISTYTNHMRRVFNEHVGSFLRNKPVRDFGSLGDVTQPNTTAYRFAANVGGGRDYKTLIRDCAIESIVMNAVCVFVDGVDINGNAVIHVVPIDAVVNHNDDFSQVLFRSAPAAVADLTADPVSTEYEYYTLVTKTGVTRYVVNGDSIVSADTVDFVTPYLDMNGNTRAPIFRVLFPLNQFIAYDIALNSRSIYEDESVLDMHLRKCTLPLAFVQGTDETFVSIANSIRAGNALIQIPNDAHIKPDFMRMDTEAPALSMKRIEEKIQRMYMTAFKDIESSSKIYTSAVSTLIGNETKSSFLLLIAQMIEGLEKELMYLVSQVYFPGNPSKWDFKVNYPNEYDAPVPVTIQGSAEDLNTENN